MTPKRIPDSAGNARVIEDPLDPWHAAALHAALDLDGPPPQAGDPLPPLWHFVYFREAARASALGHDGHPRTGDFIPDVGLPRRMWAGGRLRFLAPLILGAPARRVSAVQNVALKQGRGGPLAFVTIRHEIFAGQTLAIREEQDLVYRPLPAPGDPAPAPAPRRADAPAWRREATADSTLLFRYSALTYNGHKIHYDLRHATEVEGYPDLVVHGPLIAQLLADLARAHAPRPLARFEFRAVSPVFRGRPFALCGAPERAGGAEQAIDLWALNEDGRLAMTARATPEPDR
ncbi:acyl-CoA dehydrogenase [Oceanicella actignis]|uniref:acyl-CoA dehydrogenase n=1 Tax=Oceanicella actignis TaxID=1189325 RepID=UPI0011E89BEB|nr:acyl-CoA dehydrogenase [Oceanicella actignis]TYO88451.1 3-methylfumaryl-CoA hydratase [Oceanicella actignis]